MKSEHVLIVDITFGSVSVLLLIFSFDLGELAYTIFFSMVKTVPAWSFFYWDAIVSVFRIAWWHRSIVYSVVNVYSIQRNYILVTRLKRGFIAFNACLFSQVVSFLMLFDNRKVSQTGGKRRKVGFRRILVYFFRVNVALLASRCCRLLACPCCWSCHGCLILQVGFRRIDNRQAGWIVCPPVLNLKLGGWFIGIVTKPTLSCT